MNYYEILGLKRGATLDEIKKSYRALAKRFHPDLNSSPDAATQFNLVQSAYDTLSDDQRRLQYNLSLDQNYGSTASDPFETKHDGAPINPQTGKKNYKYYRTNQNSRSKTNANVNPNTKVRLEYRSRYFSSRFWFLLAVAYTLSFFVILPLTSNISQNDFRLTDFFFSIPLILFGLTCLIDTAVASNTRVAIVMSSQDFVKNFDKGMKFNMAKMVRFMVFQVPDLDTDYFDHNNSRSESIPFTNDFEPVVNQKFKFHCTPLLRFCFRISPLENQAKAVWPDFHMAGNIHVYRSLLVLLILLNSLLHNLSEGLSSLLVFITLIVMMVLKNQSLTS